MLNSYLYSPLTQTNEIFQINFEKNFFSNKYYLNSYNFYYNNKK